eukprot:3170977-Pleurochrysis_carterae.AAC.1
MHEVADGEDVLHCVAVGTSYIFTLSRASWQQAADHDLQSVQLCVHASKPLMAAFAQAPSDEPFASPMRLTLYKVYATDLVQGPCDGPLIRRIP